MLLLLGGYIAIKDTLGAPRLKSGLFAGDSQGILRLQKLRLATEVKSEVQLILLATSNCNKIQIKKPIKRSILQYAKEALIWHAMSRSNPGIKVFPKLETKAHHQKTLSDWSITCKMRQNWIDPFTTCYSVD